MKITIIGAGYVGLVQAVCLADFGFNVTCIEIDPEKLRELKFGRIPFYEPGLEDLLSSSLHSGRFEVALNVQIAIESSDVIFVCVGTPQNEDGSADLSQIEAVGRLIAEHANSNK